MVGEEKFCLRWNDFQLSISQSFQEFRDDLVDVTIFCGKKKVEAHRLVLCACSAVFRDLILKNTAPNPSILLFDVELVELYNLLDFMYKGEVSVSQDRLQKFLDLAEKLEVKGLYQQGKPESEKPKAATHHPQPSYQKAHVEKKIVNTDLETKIREPVVSVIEEDNDVNIVAVKHEKDTDDVVTLIAPDYPIEETQNYEYESYDSTSAAEDPGYMYAHSSFGRDDKMSNFGDLDYPCILCGKSYKTAGSLKNHRSLYHRDEITKNKCPNYTII